MFRQLCLSAFFCFSIWCQTPGGVDGALYPGASKPAVKTARQQLPSAIAGVDAPRPVVLPEVDLAAERVTNRRGQLPLGTTRKLPQVEGAWTSLASGRHLWRGAIRSPGAVAMRVHFTGFDAADGKVWVYGADADPETTYTGSGPNKDGDFWSGTVEGDTLMSPVPGATG